MVKNPPANAGGASLVAQMAKNPPTMQESWVLSLGLPTLVFLTGESHGQRSLAGYSAWDCKGVGHTLSHTHTHTHTHTTTRIFLIKDISKQLAVVTPASLSVALHLL